MSAQSSRGTGWNRLRLAVLERDGWVCSTCSKALEGDDATVDHVIAKASGGTDDTSNLVAMCRICNSKKQDRTLTRLNWVNRRWLDAA